jgi:hypothetical protein
MSDSWSESVKLKTGFPVHPFKYPIVCSEDKFFFDNTNSKDVVLLFGCSDRKYDLKASKFIRVDVDVKVNPDYLDYRLVKEKFDVVVARNVVEHLSVGEIRELFKFFVDRKVVLLFNFPNAWSNYGVFASDYTHKSFFSSRCYGGLLREAGFSRISFFRCSNARFKFVRQFVSEFVGLDFCNSLVVKAEVV